MAARAPFLAKPPGAVRLMLTGDVMLGRGVDAVLPRSVPPVIYEAHCQSARDYVELAVQVRGRGWLGGGGGGGGLKQRTHDTRSHIWTRSGEWAAAAQQRVRLPLGDCSAGEGTERTARIIFC